MGRGRSNGGAGRIFLHTTGPDRRGSEVCDSAIWRQRLQEQTYAAEDDTAELFRQGDWTTLDWSKWNATQRQDKTPHYVAEMIIHRTAGMARRIDAFPPQAKPILVGVGLNHLGGPDGLEGELRARGFSVSRYVTHCSHG